MPCHVFSADFQQPKYTGISFQIWKDSSCVSLGLLKLLVKTFCFKAIKKKKANTRRQQNKDPKILDQGLYHLISLI